MLCYKAGEAIFIAVFIFSSLSQIAIVEPRPDTSSFYKLHHHRQAPPHKQGQGQGQGQGQKWHSPNPVQIAKKTTHGGSQAAWLQAHNKVRKEMGEPPMKWDKSLARYAKHFAGKRMADCHMIHSNGPHGENIFWSSRNVYSPREVVQKWVDEHHNYKRKGNVCAPNKVCGHYKQIVWRDSTNVGCAMVQCHNGGAYAICSYSPPGNYKGEDPFTSHE